MTTLKHLRPTDHADQAAEAIRSLNHATIHGGYEWASDIDAVTGRLSTTVYSMTQALSQMQRWLHRQEEAGRIGHDEGADVPEAVEELSGAMLRAAARIERLHEALNDMRRVSAHLTTIIDDETGR